jgi:hypothetical protein
MMETNSGVWLDRTLRTSACGTWWSASAAGGHPLALLQLEPTLVAQPAALERVAAAVAAMREANPAGVLRTTEVVVDTRRAWLVVAALPAPTLADLLAALPTHDALPTHALPPTHDAPPTRAALPTDDVLPTHDVLPMALAPGAGAGIAVDVAQALRSLHANGLSHGDLAADNVVLTSAGTAVLVEVGVLAAVRDAPTDAGRDAVAWGTLVRDLARATTSPEADLLLLAAATAESGDLATAARQLGGQAAGLSDFADRESLAAMLPIIGPTPVGIPTPRSTMDRMTIGPTTADPTAGPIRVRFGRGLPDSAILAARASTVAAPARRRSPRAIQLAVLVVLLLLSAGAALWWVVLLR